MVRLTTKKMRRASALIFDFYPFPPIGLNERAGPAIRAEEAVGSEGIIGMP
jgi:hypothetical protein